MHDQDLSRNSSPRTATPASRLRIAQIAPLYESVPPRLYGGTERVVSYLTEELVRRGHDVTLFASGDSATTAKLVPGFKQALRLANLDRLGPSFQWPMLDRVFAHAADFDVIHSHLDYWAFPLARMVATPTVSTLHCRLDTPALLPVYERYPSARIVSISDAQRAPLPRSNWLGTVYHGLPMDLLPFTPGRGKYLAFLGRISPEKRPDLAIEIARRCGIPLKLAAKVDKADAQYFEAVIKPKLAPPDIELIGEINDREKARFLGDALALLFPIDWPEPFGLVMIEAMACGTPVIARPCGSVPEVLRAGVTGLVAAELGGLVAAVKRIETISRADCRHEFEQRFSAQAMADGYEQMYHKAMAGLPSDALGRAPAPPGAAYGGAAAASK